MEAYFKSIKEKIEADVSEVLTIELWNNQVESQGDAISTPAVYLGFGDEIEYSDYSTEGAQQGGFMLQVTIVAENLVDNLNNDSGTDWSIFALKQKVYKALQGFKPVDSTINLIRKTETPDQNHDGVYVWTQNYDSNVVDEEAVPETTEHTIDLSLTVSLKIDNPVIRTGYGLDRPVVVEDYGVLTFYLSGGLA